MNFKYLDLPVIMLSFSFGIITAMESGKGSQKFSKFNEIIPIALEFGKKHPYATANTLSGVASGIISFYLQLQSKEPLRIKNCVLSSLESMAISTTATYVYRNYIMNDEMNEEKTEQTSKESFLNSDSTVESTKELTITIPGTKNKKSDNNSLLNHPLFLQQQQKNNKKCLLKLNSPETVKNGKQ